jgi:hypothetical protein
MSRLSRLLTVSAFALALTAFQDPGGMFTVDFPEGWTPQTQGQGISAVQSPDLPGVNCNAQAPEVPGTAATSQEQLDMEMKSPLAPATWASIMGIDPAKLQVSEGEARAIDGKYMQIATLAVDENALNNPVKMTIRLSLFAKPGRFYLAGCYAITETYPQVKDIFEKTVSSLRPL